jgi:hypothetical protein
MNRLRIEFCDPREYDDAGFLEVYLVEDHGETKLLDVDALHNISMNDVVRILRCIDSLDLKINYKEPEDGEH